MSGTLGETQLALLLKASVGVMAACDEGESRDLSLLCRVGLLVRHEAGIHMLTDAGRRYLLIESSRFASQSSR